MQAAGAALPEFAIRVGRAGNRRIAEDADGAGVRILRAELFFALFEPLLPGMTWLCRETHAPTWAA